MPLAVVGETEEEPGPAVVGVEDLDIDLNDREARVGDLTIREGAEISIDGLRGEVYLGVLATVVPDIEDPWLTQLLAWADEFRTLEVWANADYPDDARRARDLGAEGIGLCRTEHMFFEEDRLPVMREMIMARNHVERDDALDRLATSVDYGGETAALEQALESALTDVADAVAEGLVAQMREIRRSAN